MKTNSPFLQPYIDNLENVDDFDFWAEWSDEHKKFINDYYGVERNSDLSIEFHINPKETYIDAYSGDPLIISGVFEGVYKFKATKNIGKHVSNRCFKDEIESWNYYEWSSDGKTVELSYQAQVGFYLDESSYPKSLKNVIAAMKTLKGFDKIRVQGKEIRLNKEQEKQLEKLRTLASDEEGLAQAISLADALGLMGNLKSEMTSEAYGILKKNGVNITKIEGL
jgi:hypothetical protein